MSSFIYDSIADFKNYVGGGANLSISTASIEPIMRQAAQQHLVPWLGEAFWKEITDDFPDPSAPYDDLLPYVQRALGFLTLHEYSKIAGIQLGENGMYRTENEMYKTPYKYQENSYRDYMLHNGYEALEELIKYLITNEADFATWTASSEYTERINTRFINHASEFRSVYSSYISRYTFEVMRPVMEDIEMAAIVPAMGQEQYDDLKAAILASTLNASQQILVRHIQKAIASFTVREAVHRLMVKLEGNNITVNERLGDQDYSKKNVPTLDRADILSRNSEIWANRYISRMVKYLDDNIDDYPLYSDYLDELAEAAEAAAIEAGTAECERPLPCGCSNDCQCYNDANQKSIVRL